MNTKIGYNIHKKSLLKSYQRHQQQKQQLQQSAYAEARRLANILIGEFGIRVVYAFGPLTYNEFTEGMPLELAVEGMPAGKLAVALGHLKQMSTFGVELIEINASDSWTRRSILQKGVVLAEREDK